ncbi:MAG: histidine kinase [Rhodospirillales bacterium]|jgi:signal transduction histidine kinase|nr:histidine kinase [Rhodospirillales bacterium]
MARDFQQDIAAIGRIEAVPTILDVVCRTTGMGFAAVARVTEDRWIACSVKDEIAFGLAPGGELKVESTICHEIRQSGEAVIINHVAEDAVYQGHPTSAMYGFQSYISMPIMLADGTFFGTLCAIDPRPHRLNTPEVVGMFKLFAELIAFHLDALDRLASSEATLQTERQDAVLREQFIAVLGHDLRNPLAAIDAGTTLLLQAPLDERALQTVGLMQRSVARMFDLIDNVLDFARGRLGGGLDLDRTADAPLAHVLEQVVAEFQASAPDRVIETAFASDVILDCDQGRIAQLFSNLLGNAIAHGATTAPIRTGASTGPEGFELWVANAGDPIAPDMMERLFRPFFRGESRPNLHGLGLGLYIASEIATAHGGTLTASSTAAETRFALRIPLG